MAFILTSFLKTYIRDEFNNKFSVALDDENEILTNIKKYTKAYDRIVFVANDPSFLEENEQKARIVFESFDKTGLFFKEKILLDDRNKKNAKEILSKANLIILNGGRCICQLNFFSEINLKDILESFEGLVIGISAGTMNLCSIVCNFAEDLESFKEPRWLNGLGFYNKIIIPHFDGETMTYQIPIPELDVIKEQILPLSNEKDFLAIPNGTYILIENNKTETIFGKAYTISNSIVKTLN